MRAKLFLILAVIFWGWSFVFTKLLLQFVTPVELLGLRLLLALPVLFIIIRIKRLPFAFTKPDYRKVLLGAGIITAHFLIQITGLKYTSATNTGWIISVTPLVMAALSYLILKEKIGTKEIIGILVATTGILLLVSGGRITSLDWLNSIGDWMVLASAHTWALYTIATRDISRKYHPLTVTFSILLPAAIITIGYMLFTSDWSSFLTIPAEPMIALLILGIACLAVAHWFWQEGVAAIGAARAGIFLYLEPVATTFLAVPYLHEQFGLFTAIGGGMVLAGVFIAQKKAKNQQI